MEVSKKVFSTAHNNSIRHDTALASRFRRCRPPSGQSSVAFPFCISLDRRRCYRNCIARRTRQRQDEHDGTAHRRQTSDTVGEVYRSIPCRAHSIVAEPWRNPSVAFGLGATGSRKLPGHAIYSRTSTRQAASHLALKRIRRVGLLSRKQTATLPEDRRGDRCRAT